MEHYDPPEGEKYEVRVLIDQSRALERRRAGEALATALSLATDIPDLHVENIGLVDAQQIADGLDGSH